MFDGVPEGFGIPTDSSVCYSTVIALPISGKHPDVFCLLYSGGKKFWHPLLPTQRHRSWRMLAGVDHLITGLRRTRSQSSAHERRIDLPRYPSKSTLHHRIKDLPSYAEPSFPSPAPAFHGRSQDNRRPIGSALSQVTSASQGGHRAVSPTNMAPRSHQPLVWSRDVDGGRATMERLF